MVPLVRGMSLLFSEYKSRNEGLVILSAQVGSLFFVMPKLGLQSPCFFLFRGDRPFPIVIVLSGAIFVYGKKSVFSSYGNASFVSNDAKVGGETRDGRTSTLWALRKYNVL